MKGRGILLPQHSYCIHLLHHHSSGFTVCLQDHVGSQQNIIPFNLLLDFHIALSSQQQLLAMASISSTHWFIWYTLRCFATSATPHPGPGSGPWCCCAVLSHILLADPLLLLNTNHGLTGPLPPIYCSVWLWNKKKPIALVFQFNTGLPLKTLVICWGPYCLLCSYAAVENVMFIPPKYRMVRQCHLRTQTMTFSLLSSLCLYATMPVYWQLGLPVKT